MSTGSAVGPERVEVVADGATGAQFPCQPGWAEIVAGWLEVVAL
jgi:hypothetical protein